MASVKHGSDGASWRVGCCKGGILLLLTFASISHFGYLMEVLEWQVSLFQNRTHKRKQDRRIARIRTVNIASSYAGHMSS